jgi:hexosaminidase
MWRVRGRTQVTVITLTVAALILILYRMSANDIVASDIMKESRAHLAKIEGIYEFPTMMQNVVQVGRQQEYDSRIMADVRGRGVSEDDRLGRRLMFPNDGTVHSGENRADNKKEDSGGSWSSGVHPFRGYRVVHLDLKGAPPRVSYYEDFFPLIRNLGATGILIEYEDMFPFSGPQLQDLPAYNAYSKADIRHILQLAADNELEVIPLIQTFGHLEFLLKLQKYTELREVQKYPQVSYRKGLECYEYSSCMHNAVNVFGQQKILKQVAYSLCHCYYPWIDPLTAFKTLTSLIKSQYCP